MSSHHHSSVFMPPTHKGAGGIMSWSYLSVSISDKQQGSKVKGQFKGYSSFY